MKGVFWKVGLWFALPLSGNPLCVAKSKLLREKIIIDAAQWLEKPTILAFFYFGMWRCLLIASGEKSIEIPLTYT